MSSFGELSGYQLTTQAEISSQLGFFHGKCGIPAMISLKNASTKKVSAISSLLFHMPLEIRETKEIMMRKTQHNSKCQICSEVRTLEH